MVSIPSSGDLQRMSPKARLNRYLELSKQAFQRAAEAGTARERARFMALGYGWRSLAQAIEESLSPLRPHGLDEAPIDPEKHRDREP